MTRILCAMPDGTHRALMTAELERKLESLGRVTYCKNAAELPEQEYTALWIEAEAVVSGWGIRVPEPETLDRCTRLRIVAHTAGSLRMFPRSLFERGVVMTTARAAIGRTVAEFCLMNALILLRRALFFADSNPGRRDYYLEPGRDRPLNETLYGKTVGLVGFGCVGRDFRKLLEPFGCRVLVADPHLDAETASTHNVERVDLHTLLRESKVVSLHAPDVPETRNMIGAEELALLADRTVLLNSARGGLVDTEALTAALRKRPIFAAIDVTMPEPLPPDHPLLTLPNVLFTPHVAGPTEDDKPHLAATAIEDMARYLRGEAPLYRVTAEDYNRMSY